MFDMLFRFETQQSAETALAVYQLWNESGFDGSQVIAPITLTRRDGTHPTGYWLAVSKPFRDPILEVLAIATIRREASGAKLSDYVVASVMTPEQIDNIARIEPVWAGSAYPFPSDL